MKAAKFTFFRRVTGLCPSAALMLTLLALTVAATTTAAQTRVYVPGKASGYFGSSDEVNPLVPALTVNGPGKITVTYASGRVTWDGGRGDSTGPNGVFCRWCPLQQWPLQEALGLGLTKKNMRVAALMGVFVPQSRVQSEGFKAIDGTKNATPLGIMPKDLFFIGTGKTFRVTQAGTLFLGINDSVVGDNSGGFHVTVSGP